MWLLESSGSGLQGQRLWLRPGKKYLIGRTSAEAGQLLITHKSISRKHLTITVDAVRQGDAQNLSSRSNIILEDLNTSKGTFVNGQSMQGQKHVVSEPDIEFTMGKCPDVFRISWFPVVLTYSFTSREMQHDPLATLRADLEQLDIKFITEYNVKSTTHVVSKKRNTSKGLQALINGRYIVSNSFTEAIIRAATTEGDEEAGESALEANFDEAWPDALQHLPPRGMEASQRPAEEYAPDHGRHNVFEGYTFIFYDKAQWENLLAPITNGRGKALHFLVVPNETQVDDFVRYVKSVAGEKGLGSFEDGSEGRGAVVVRYVPAKGDDVQWFMDFTTTVSLQLDHRAIEQGEFLEAILAMNAAILRRPLEVEPDVQPAAAPPVRQVRAAQSSTNHSSVPQEPSQQDQPQPARKSRVRRPATKRFKGFDDDDDDDDSPSIPVPARAQVPVPDSNRDPSPETHEEGLFVSQRSGMAESQDEAPGTRRSARKRGAPIPEEDDVMEDVAPAAAAAKRRRIERGEDPVIRNPTPEAQVTRQTKGIGKAKKAKKEIDVLEVARKTREEAEAKARADNDDNAGPDEVDLAEIRRLAIVEEIQVRRPPPRRDHEQDVEDGRWDPRWNGRKNFKKFRARGEDARRLAQKIIVPLVQVKAKGFGLGDDYWLEDEGNRKESQTRSQDQQKSNSQAQRKRPPQRRTVSSDSEDDDGDGMEVSLAITELEEQQSTSRPKPTRSQPTAATASQSTASRSQAVAKTTAGNKRPAPTAAVEQPSKRPRQTRRLATAADSDSDEDRGFKFGRRR